MNVEAVYTDCYQQAIYCNDTKVLTMKWLPGTAKISYPQFQASVFQFTVLILDRKAQLICIDSTDYFGPHPEDGFWQWRGETISPMLMKAGVQKYAFLWPEGTPIPDRNGQPMPGEDFPTTHFTSRDEAMTWLST